MKYILLLLTLFVSASLGAQEINKVEYFFDTDPGPGFGTNISVTNPDDSIDQDFIVPVTGLQAGFHLFVIRAKDTTFWTPSIAKLIYINSGINEYPSLENFANYLINGEYFFNNDPGEGNGIPYSYPVAANINLFDVVSISNLSIGSHKLGVRVRQLNEQWSSSFFVNFSVTSLPSECSLPSTNFTYTNTNANSDMAFQNTSTNVNESTTYQWDIDANGSIEYTTQNINHTFATSGSKSVKLSVINAIGCSTSLTKVVEVGPYYAKAITPNQAPPYCTNDTIILTAPNGSNWVWNDGVTTQQREVSISQVYQVVYNDPNGSLQISYPLNIQIGDLPEYTLIANATANGQLLGSAILLPDDQLLSYDYLWSNSETTNSIYNLNAGVFYVTISDGNCDIIDTANIINITTDSGTDFVKVEYFLGYTDPGPGNGTTIFTNLAGDSIDLYFDLDTMFLNPGINRLNYRVMQDDGLWSTINYTYFFIDNIPVPVPHGGIVLLEYFFDTDPGGGLGEHLIINPALDSIDDDYTFEFPNDLSPGLHTMVVRAKNGAGDYGIEKVISVIVDAPLPIVDKNMYPLISGEYFFDSDPGEAQGISFSFNPDDTIAIKRVFSINSLSEGSHKLGIRVKELNGDWSVTKYITITVVAPTCSLPIADFTFTNTNVGQNTMFDNTSTNTITGTYYEWDIFADGIVDYTTEDINYNFTMPGIYDVHLKANNDTNCSTSIVKSVAINPLDNNDISMLGPNVFCNGDTSTLIAPMGNHYLWNTGDTTQNIEVTSSGIYQVYYLDANNQWRLSNEVLITVHRSLNIIEYVSPANGAASNGSISLEIKGGTGYVHNVLWSTNATSNTIVNLNAGLYHVTISDTNCPETLHINLPQITSPTNTLIIAEYFIGNDPGPGNGTPILITQNDDINSYFSQNISSLPFGSTVIYYRVKDNLGFWSSVASTLFYKSDSNQVPSAKPLIVSGHYYFDEDEGFNDQGLFIFAVPDSTINHIASIVFDELSPGLHSLNIRVKNDENNWSNDYRLQFLVDFPLPKLDTNEYPIVKAEYFMGADPGEGNGLPIYFNPDFTIDQNSLIDLQSLSIGSHTAYLRVMTLNREWSIIKPITFIIFEGNCLQPIAYFTHENGEVNEDIDFTNYSTNLSAEVQYQWDVDNDGSIESNAADLTHNFTTAGIHIVKLKVINSLGCFESFLDSLYIGDYPIDTIIVIDSTNLCGGDTAILKAPIGMNYLWSNGETSDSIIVTQTGIFQVSYIDPFGTQRLSPQVSLSVSPEINFYVEINNANAGVNNGSANIFVPNGNVNQYNYNWSNSSTDAMQDSLTSGTYYVTVSSGSCDRIETVVIGEIPVENGLVMAEYYLGFTDPGPGNGEAFVIPKDSSINHFYTNHLDTLETGIYRYNVRVKDEMGFWSPSAFLLISVSDTIIPVIDTLPDLISIEYFFGNVDIGEDSSEITAISLPAQNLNDTLNIDVSTIGTGSKSIYLRVKNAEGQYSIVKGGTFQICTPPSEPVLSAPAALCQGLDLMLMATTPTPNATFKWTGPNNFTSTLQNPIINNVSQIHDGSYSVQAVLNGNCFSTQDEQDININLLPSMPGNISSTIFECGENTVFFTPIIQNATNYIWNFPSGISIVSGNNTNNIAVSFDNFAGAFDIKVKGSNSCGETNFSNILPINTCICSEIGKLTDGGIGSLRHALGCAQNNDTIALDQNFSNQNFNINLGPLLINKNITLQAPSLNNLNRNHESNRTSDRLIFNNETGGPLINVVNGNTLVLNQVDIYVGTINGAIGILNEGFCNLKNTKIIKSLGSNTAHLTNTVGASMDIVGDCLLIEE